MMSDILDFIIIGAGISGISSAISLIQKDSNASYLILDKSRGVGGRMATRRVENQPVDTGAQYFTIKIPGFAEFCKPLIKNNIIKEWNKEFYLYKNGKWVNAHKANRYIAPLGMTSIIKQLIKDYDLNIEKGTQIEKVKREDNYWILTDSNQNQYRSKNIICTAPYAQSSALFPEYTDKKTEAKHSACLCFIYQWESNTAKLNKDFGGIWVDNNSPITWLSHDSSKRNNKDFDILVVHTEHRFAIENYQKEIEELLPEINTELNSILPDINTEAAQVHLKKWLYAGLINSTQPIINKDNGLYITGDWSIESRVEDAWASGKHIVNQINL